MMTVIITWLGIRTPPVPIRERIMGAKAVLTEWGLIVTRHAAAGWVLVESWEMGDGVGRLTDCLHDAEECHDEGYSLLEDTDEDGRQNCTSQNTKSDGKSVDSSLVAVRSIHTDGLNGPEDDNSNVVDSSCKYDEHQTEERSRGVDHSPWEQRIWSEQPFPKPKANDEYTS